MRIPKRVKIGAKVYPVQWVDNLRDTDDTKLFGRFDTVEGVITLSKACGVDGELLDTFIHECLHAMNKSVKLDLDEDTVHRLAFMLAAFLVDNKLLREGGE
jgi:predicted nucleotide-binding protein (sugar kinase/HSP70/actin superfamily)